jgi:hypothetical protein
MASLTGDNGWPLFSDVSIRWVWLNFVYGLKVQNQLKLAHGFVQGIMIASNSVSFFHTRSLSMDLHCFVQQHFFTS